MELSRRDFLKLLGVSAAATSVGALGAGTLFSIPDRLFERISDGPKIETWKTSVCTLCPGGCGIKVRLIDGIPVKITGNPLHPVNRGAICPMAEGGIEMVFHPKRVRQPLKRSGERGANQWQPISWQEATDMLRGRLNDLKTAGTPEKLLVLSERDGSLLRNYLQQVMNGFGSPNLYFDDGMDRSSLPVRVTQGLNAIPAYDIQNADCVLNFGADLLDDLPSPVHYNQLYARMRNRPQNHNADIYHFSSKLTRTAAQSTKWFPVNPGSMAGVALSIASVMIKDRSYDKSFINGRSFGFKNWKDSGGNEHMGFEALVTGQYYPERVSKISGMPAEKIVTLAREFAAADHAVALFGDEAVSSSNGFYTAWSVYCLNALKGNLNQPGGVLFPQPIQPSLNENAQATNRLSGESAFDENAIPPLLNALVDRKPYAVDTLILNQVNPLFTMPDQAAWHQALQNIPFIVSYTPFIDDTGLFADLVLPAPSFLENLDVLTTVPGMEFNHLSVQQPVMEALYETRPIGDVLAECTQSQPSSGNYETAVKHFVQEIYDSGKGTIISESSDRSWIEFLKKRGWQPFAYSTFDEFWDVLLEKGGWWNPIYAEQRFTKSFQTKSGKFEFFSQALLAGADKHGKDADIICLPHHEPLKFAKDKADFPFHLVSYASLANHRGKGSYSGLLQELSAVFSREFWNSWVEINPLSAEQNGLADGDHVAVISAAGRLVLKVKTDPTVMPDVLAIPFGQGHAAGTVADQRIGENPMQIFDPETDPISKNWSHISTRVRIEKTSAKIS